MTKRTKSEWCSAKDLAEELGVKVTAVYNYCDTSRLVGGCLIKRRLKSPGRYEFRAIPQPAETESSTYRPHRIPKGPFTIVEEEPPECSSCRETREALARQESQLKAEREEWRRVQEQFIKRERELLEELDKAKEFTRLSRLLKRFGRAS